MSKQVPYFSFTSAPRGLKSKWKSAVAEVIDNGQFIGGYFVTKFESEFGKFLKCENVVGVGNGLDGLAIALKSLGVGKGDTVAVPAHTFIACWLAIEQVGATRVGIDDDENGLIYNFTDNFFNQAAQDIQTLVCNKIKRENILKQLSCTELNRLYTWDERLYKEEKEILNLFN